MSGNIFLISGDESLIELNEQAYDSEGMLQRLLAKYPDLLGSNQLRDGEAIR